MNRLVIYFHSTIVMLVMSGGANSADSYLRLTDQNQTELGKYAGEKTFAWGGMYGLQTKLKMSKMDLQKP